MTLRIDSCEVDSVSSEAVYVQLTESPGDTDSGDKMSVSDEPRGTPVVSLVHA